MVQRYNIFVFTVQNYKIKGKWTKKKLLKCFHKIHSHCLLNDLSKDEQMAKTRKIADGIGNFWRFRETWYIHPALLPVPSSEISFETLAGAVAAGGDQQACHWQQDQSRGRFLWSFSICYNFCIMPKEMPVSLDSCRTPAPRTCLGISFVLG